MVFYVVLIGWDEETRTLRLFSDQRAAERYAAEIRGKRPVYVDVKACELPVMLKESSDG